MSITCHQPKYEILSGTKAMKHKPFSKHHLFLYRVKFETSCISFPIQIQLQSNDYIYTYVSGNYSAYVYFPSDQVTSYELGYSRCSVTGKIAANPLATCDLVTSHVQHKSYF